MAQFGLKLWENACQMIPDIPFFDAKKKSSINMFAGNKFAIPPLSPKIGKLPVLEEL